jgi:regulator of cell morphogenesis and NO signaling
MTTSETVLLPLQMTVNEAVRRYPRTVAVFHRHGIDACCGGALPIAEAAARHGIDVAQLLAQLLEEMRPAAREEA